MDNKRINVDQIVAFIKVFNRNDSIKRVNELDKDEMLFSVKLKEDEKFTTLQLDIETIHRICDDLNKAISLLVDFENKHFIQEGNGNADA